MISNRSQRFGQATPLLLTVAVIELSDIAFAVGFRTHHLSVLVLFLIANLNESLTWCFFFIQVDSIPAVFGVTRDPFIVYTSNIFAIVGNLYIP